MAKVPNILPDERIYRQSTGDPVDLAECGGPPPFTETGGDVRKRLGILLPRGWRGYFRGAWRRQVGVSAEASCPLFDFAEERLETPTPGVFIFGQPGLKQTQKTKSVVHT
jgi:hypothetical protein